MADFIDIETPQSKSKKMSGSVGVGDAGGNCIVFLVVVGEGWWTWGVVVGCSGGLCSDVVMVTNTDFGMGGPVPP